MNYNEKYGKEYVNGICDTFDYKLTKKQIESIIDEFNNDDYVWGTIDNTLFDIIKTYVKE